MSPHGVPPVKIGQTWRRSSDNSLHRVEEQMLDKSSLEDQDDWRLRNLETNKLGDWIFGFSIRRKYTLESEAPA